MVSNGDSPIPQRLAAGLNADGAAHGRPSSKLSSSSKVGTVGTGESCSDRDPLPPAPPSFRPLISPQAGVSWCPTTSACRCSASSQDNPRCFVMASNHSHSSSIHSPRCGRCGPLRWDDLVDIDDHVRTRSRYADSSRVTGSRTIPTLIQPLLLSL